MAIQDDHHSIDRPSWYRQGGYELIDVIEAWDLDSDAYLTQAVQYIFRSAFKGNQEDDLKKAIWYIQRSIQRHKPKKKRWSEMTSSEKCQLIDGAIGCAQPMSPLQAVSEVDHGE